MFYHIYSFSYLFIKTELRTMRKTMQVLYFRVIYRQCNKMYMIKTEFECNHNFCLNSSLKTYLKKKRTYCSGSSVLFVLIQKDNFLKVSKNYIKPESILTRI